MVQNYIVDKLTLSDLKENGKVIVPNFQRGVVWTKAHRKEFIETVKSGDPFGVVLVQQSAPSEPYYLIDGLQRLSTLKAYMDNPLEFVDENYSSVDQQKILSIFKEKYESLGMQLPAVSKLEKEKKSLLKKTIQSMKSAKTIPDANEVWPDIANHLGVNKDKFSIIKAFSSFYSAFVDSLKLPDIIIHAIVYQGPKERLPQVFETLNTSSVSLTKYEVFASQWPTLKIRVDDDELVEKVWSKYDALKKSSSFEVDITKDSIHDEGMTLFEYCFGLSELICDDNKPYAFLFNKGKKTTDPTGFEILSLVCGSYVNKADDLWEDEYLGGSTGAFLIQIKDALIETISIVADAMRNWIIDISGTMIKIPGTYQIYYMIAAVFQKLYSFDTKTKSIQKNDASAWVLKFKKNASKWFLAQTLEGFWNQHRQVGDLNDVLNNRKDIDYSTSITRERWNSIIKTFQDNNKDGYLTRTIAIENKLLLNYLYRLLLVEDANRVKFFQKNTDDGQEIEYDIEHIVPVAKFSSFKEAFSMSALGNLCYLPVKDNRSKRDHTIYEYALDRPSLTYDSSFLQMIDYPTREGLQFIDATEDQFKPAYEALVSSREKTIFDKLIDLIIQ